MKNTLTVSQELSLMVIEAENARDEQPIFATEEEAQDEMDREENSFSDIDTLEDEAGNIVGTGVEIEWAGGYRTWTHFYGPNHRDEALVWLNKTIPAGA